MSREHCLLDRIAADAGRGRKSAAASATEDVEALLESVRRNLARLLGARHGMCETLDDYGLPALSDLDAANTTNRLARLQTALQTTIEKYEPRLRHVRVSIPENAVERHTLRFRIEATMPTRNSGDQRVWYETAVRATGKIDVEG